MQPAPSWELAEPSARQLMFSLQGLRARVRDAGSQPQRQQPAPAASGPSTAFQAASLQVGSASQTRAAGVCCQHSKDRLPPSQVCCAAWPGMRAAEGSVGDSSIRRVGHAPMCCTAVVWACNSTALPVKHRADTVQCNCQIQSVLSQMLAQHLWGSTVATSAHVDVQVSTWTLCNGSTSAYAGPQLTACVLL